MQHGQQLRSRCWINFRCCGVRRSADIVPSGIFHHFRSGIDAEALHQVGKGLLAAVGQLDQRLDALDVEGFELGADGNQLGVFCRGEGFGLAFGDEVVVIFPGFGGEADIDLLQEIGFGGGLVGESGLERIENEPIGLDALLRCFGLQPLGEFWGKVEEDSGHGDGA
jgi:hypothetical protein